MKQYLTLRASFKETAKKEFKDRRFYIDEWRSGYGIFDRDGKSSLPLVTGETEHDLIRHVRSLNNKGLKMLKKMEIEP